MASFNSKRIAVLSNMLSPLIFLLWSSVVKADSLPSHSPCRFAPLYSQADILHNSTAFAEDVFYWEGQFHQNGVSYNQENAMTYDGTLLNPHTGFANASEKHPFSAASKESLQVSSMHSSIHLADSILVSRSWSTHMQLLAICEQPDLSIRRCQKMLRNGRSR